MFRIGYFVPYTECLNIVYFILQTEYKMLQVEYLILDIAYYILHTEYYFTAIILISTFTNFGRFATSTVSLAGAVSSLK